MRGRQIVWFFLLLGLFFAMFLSGFYTRKAFEVLVPVGLVVVFPATLVVAMWPSFQIGFTQRRIRRTGVLNKGVVIDFDSSHLISKYMIWWHVRIRLNDGKETFADVRAYHPPMPDEHVEVLVDPLDPARSILASAPATLR